MRYSTTPKKSQKAQSLRKITKTRVKNRKDFLLTRLKRSRVVQQVLAKNRKNQRNLNRAQGKPRPSIRSGPCLTKIKRKRKSKTSALSVRKKVTILLSVRNLKK